MRIMESSSQKHVCAVGRTEARLVPGSQNDTIPVAGAPGISVVTLCECLSQLSPLRPGA